MKKISIIALLALVAMLGEYVYSFLDFGRENVVRTIESDLTHKSKDYFSIAYPLNVKPSSDIMPLDSVYNKKAQVRSLCAPAQMYVGVALSKSVFWLMLIAALGVIVFVIKILIKFYKFLISLYRKQVFTIDNAKRLRFISYCTVSLGLLGMLADYAFYYQAAQQVIIPGYVITGFKSPYSISELIVIVLFTEIFAYGVKLQEEQDLTV